jgi:hypothetical protein
MKRATLRRLLLVAVMIIAWTIPAAGQNREKFVITARAGGINAVTGYARMHTKGNFDWQQLTIKDDLEAGDLVATGQDGRVEMLLNPGSYFRVAANTQFVLVNNSLDKLEINLISGTAIVEATGADDTELMINISTPHAKMAIIRRGLYRLNVIPGDATELIVRKGRVLLEDSQTVKDGSKVTFNGGSLSIAKLERAHKNSSDDLEEWSKERAKTLADLNQRLVRRDRNALLASLGSDSLDNSFFSGSLSGLWYFSVANGCYSFLPFYLGWGSPYGHSYGTSFYGSYDCNSCQQRNETIGSYDPRPGTGTSGGGTTPGPTSPSLPSTPPPTAPPPAPRDAAPLPDRERPFGKEPRL